MYTIKFQSHKPKPMPLLNSRIRERGVGWQLRKEGAKESLEETYCNENIKIIPRGFG